MVSYYSIGVASQTAPRRPTFDLPRINNRVGNLTLTEMKSNIVEPDQRMRVKFVVDGEPHWSDIINSS